MEILCRIGRILQPNGEVLSSATHEPVSYHCSLLKYLYETLYQPMISRNYQTTILYQVVRYPHLVASEE